MRLPQVSADRVAPEKLKSHSLPLKFSWDRIRDNAMKPLKWTTTSRQHAYMSKRQSQNKTKSFSSPNENWMSTKLKTTPYKWTRQAVWGYRVFDFWSSHIGVAVEVDGKEHDVAYDAYRDEYNFRRSGIIVLRVRNGNDEDAAVAIEAISQIGDWKERRSKMGLENKKTRLALVDVDSSRCLLKEFLCSLNHLQPVASTQPVSASSSPVESSPA
jgi:very-short-patch-repair endonuclease